MSVLAINGGEKTIPAGLLKNWPPISATDKKMVLASLGDDKHAWGPHCDALQEEWKRWNGNRYCWTTNSGTAALHMAVAASGASAGDEIITPAYSWTSSVSCILHHGCVPVFADIDFATANIDPSKIEAAVSERTRAILAVHLHGLPARMDAIMDIAGRHNLAVIEDCCQAHGAKYRGRKVGAWGDCAAFSFNQNKCLCSGEGGIFVTDDEEMAASAGQLWSFGETRTPLQNRDYHAYALGWMYRNNDLTAAFGRAQLTKLDGYLETQRKNAAILLKELKSVRGLILPTEPKGHGHNWYNFTCRMDMKALGWNGSPARLRDAMMKAMNAEGVPAHTWQRYILPAMTVFRAKNAYGHGCPWSCPYTKDVQYDPAAFPVAQKHCDTHFGMTMPLRAPNDTKVAKAVAHGIRKVFENVGKLDVDKILAPK